MKLNVPEALKADLPQTPWGKILGATPVIMTVIATLLAGLASSEMTRAQYDRSFAAQLQSKVGDQWNFFQGKKLRGAVQRSTLDLMAATGQIRPLDREALAVALAGTPAALVLDTEGGRRALAALVDGALPKLEAGAATPAEVKAALEAADGTRLDADLDVLVAKASPGQLAEALRETQAQAQAFDVLNKPIAPAIAQMERQLVRSGTDAAFRRDFIAARILYESLRYDTESKLNQAVAGVLELQVHKSNLSAERHHSRSQKFFYGMLAAQMGVVIATLAMAARQRSLLWSLAAGAGTAAIAFALYVYLYL
jgi:hypothetical protein